MNIHVVETNSTRITIHTPMDQITIDFRSMDHMLIYFFHFVIIIIIFVMGWGGACYFKKNSYLKHNLRIHVFRQGYMHIRRCRHMYNQCSAAEYAAK